MQLVSGWLISPTVHGLYYADVVSYWVILHDAVELGLHDVTGALKRKTGFEWWSVTSIYNLMTKRITSKRPNGIRSSHRPAHYPRKSATYTLSTHAQKIWILFSSLKMLSSFRFVNCLKCAVPVSEAKNFHYCCLCKKYM